MTVGTASPPSWFILLRWRDEFAIRLLPLWRVNGTFGFTREGTKKHISPKFHFLSTKLVCGYMSWCIIPLNTNISNHHALDHHSKVSRQEDGPWRFCAFDVVPAQGLNWEPTWSAKPLGTFK